MVRRIGRVLRELLFVALLALVLFSARSSLADHYVVPTSSMEYTLMPGDRVLVNKLAYGLRVPFLGWRITAGASPARGEVVVFDSPETGKRLIKRIVAIGGDQVEIQDGHLVLNGRSTALPSGGWTERIGDREIELNLSAGPGPAIGPETIPPGQVLVMGDYRGNSHDGRLFGLIPEDQVYGRAAAVFLRSGEGFVWLPL
jgi:signal peptidase I